MNGDPHFLFFYLEELLNINILLVFQKIVIYFSCRKTTFSAKFWPSKTRECDDFVRDRKLLLSKKNDLFLWYEILITFLKQMNSWRSILVPFLLCPITFSRKINFSCLYIVFRNGGSQSAKMADFSALLLSKLNGDTLFLGAYFTCFMMIYQHAKLQRFFIYLHFPANVLKRSILYSKGITSLYSLV